MFDIIIFGLLGVGSLYFLYKGNVDGAVTLQDGRTYSREKNPGMYWFSQFFGAVLVFVVLFFFAVKLGS